MSVIHCYNVNYSIQNHHIIRDFSYGFQKGKITAITGVSGCGKSTLLNIISLVTDPSSGKIVIAGQDTTKWSDSARRQFWRTRASFIYQDYGVVDDETLWFNICLHSHYSKQDLARMNEILSSVGLANRGSQIATILSGGEKQRLGVARAIFKNADVIFADEPTASLDADNSSMIIDLFNNLSSKGATIILATHDQTLLPHCDEVIDLSN